MSPELPAIRRRLYALAFIDEFAPLYALFTLWFNDNGISTGQLSVVFLLWAVLGIVLEVPSGALADRVDRRVLLGAAFGLRAVGMGVWLIWPSMTGLVAGAVLWAVHDSMASGAWEALIHDQLDAVGRAETYGVVIARIGQCTHIGLAAASGAATGLLAVGFDIVAIGWLNTAVHLVAIAMVMALPDVRWVAEQAEQPDESGWWGTLLSGLTAARRSRDVFRLTIVGGVVAGLFVIDEYVPLMARLRGAPDASVPIIVLGVWIGLILGGEAAARHPGIRGANLASAMVAGCAVMAFALAFDSPWALLAIGVGYATIELTWVVCDARFQAIAPVATRATVTSVRSLGEGVVGGLAFLFIAVRSEGDDPTAPLHLVVGVLALVALLVWKWVPPGDRQQQVPR